MYALVKNNKVENTIIADEAFVALIEADWDEIVPMVDGLPGMEYTKVAGVWTAPVVNPVVVPPLPRHISVGAFYDRFGDQRYPILSSTDAGVQALIKDTQVRKYIDLDRTDLATGLNMIVAAGFSIVPADIINAPIQPTERP